MPLEPLTLQLPSGRARLEPLRADHAQALFDAGNDPDVWRYMPAGRPRTVADVDAFIRRALTAAAAGTELPFAIIDRTSGGPVGSTRFLEINPGNRSLEIGATWLARPAQRTSINTECKYLLLRHAFESLGMVRVQLKTDGRNLQSQAAIQRIGGVREGVLRRSRILSDGFIRDTVYFSILDHEWPQVRASLERRLCVSR